MGVDSVQKCGANSRYKAIFSANVTYADVRKMLYSDGEEYDLADLKDEYEEGDKMIAENDRNAVVANFQLQKTAAVDHCSDRQIIFSSKRVLKMLL
ncbi:unnamed protein product [Toxocara canis]|uniref:Ubiquitin-like domain-containing protein n=1 Tax=Toxocara canis TaxID=6265 RepID=A0A183TVI0_TOXCA|nr:unnamed protein product [Toxocara canis]